MNEKKRRTYTKPKITFEKKIEAFAATCIGNPSAKAAPGAPNTFHLTCDPAYLFS